MKRTHNMQQRVVRSLLLFFSLCLLSGIELAAQQNNIWTMPQWYYRHTSNSYAALPASVDYPGTAATNTHNAMQDANGNLLFFIVDDIIYDKDGYMIDYMYYNSISVKGTAEIAIVPDPGNCQRYYIIAAGRQNYAVGFSNKLPYYAVLDLSQPSMYYSGRFGALTYNGFGNTTSIAALTPGFVVEASKQGGVFIAASKLRSDNTRLVFISNGYGIYRYKINSSGFSYDNYYLPYGPCSFNQISVRGEMELIELPGGYRIAAPFDYEYFSYPTITAGQAIYTADLDNSGTLIPGTNQYFVFNYTNTDVQRPYHHGLEFSPSGNILYITHNVSSLHPNPVQYFDFGNPGLGIQTLAIPLASDYQFSQIEIGRNGKLYMAVNNRFGVLSNPDVPNVANFTTQNYPVGVSYSFNYEGVSTPDYNLKSYIMPDQIDGMDYSASFFANPVCCMLNTKYNIDSYTATASGTWLPGSSSNPFGSTTGIVTVKEELIIPAGVSVTIQNMQFRFAPGAKVTVQRGTGSTPGGRLTINNTVFTTDMRCDPQAMWLGVQVHGYSNQNQTPMSTSQQGWFTMQNNSVIEHAHKGAVAVKINSSATYPYLYSSYDLSYTGGVIRAANSVFRNNRMDVEFRNYIAPSGANNQSYITDCQLITNGPLNNSAYPPQYHVAMYSTQGISISGNDIRNNTPSIYSYSQRGYGIYSNNAQFFANARCASLYLPCSAYDPNVFQDLYYGIYAYSSTGAHSFSASRNRFINNIYGIYCYGPDLASILLNTFEVFRSSAPNPTIQTYGVYLNGSTGYRVEENTFTEYADPVAPPNGNTYGVIVNNSGNLHNQIYKNTFSNIRVGAQAQGTNGENYAYGDPNASNQGLQFRCNTFTGNLYQADITVTSGRIDYQQGYCLPSSNPLAVRSPAGNRFSHSLNTPHNDISANASVLSFNYAHHADVVTTPLYYNSAVVTASQCASIIDPVYYSAAACPSLINDGIIIIRDRSLTKETDSVRATLDRLRQRVNGGDTQGLLQQIASDGGSTQSLNRLKAASPFLSDEVLIAYIRSGAPKEHIRDVILANSPVSDAVNDVLNEYTFPARMRAAITEAQTGTSAMSTLQYEINSTANELDRLVDEQLRMALNNPEGIRLAEAAAILEAEDKPARREQLYSVYVLMNETQKAEKLKKELLAAGSEHIVTLNSATALLYMGDTESAEAIALTLNEEKSGITAGNFLLMMRDSLIPGVIELLEPADRKTVPANGSAAAAQQHTQLRIFPNPSDGSSISLELDEATEGTNMLVHIYSATGQQVQSLRFAPGSSLLRFTADELAAGVYIVKLLSGNELISVQKLVIKR